jgi:hypothetical protein
MLEEIAFTLIYVGIGGSILLALAWVAEKFMP